MEFSGEGKRELLSFFPMEESISIPDFDDRILTPNENEEVRPVHTHPLHEFKFVDYCRKNGLVHYLPLRKIWKIENYNKKGKLYHYRHEVLRPMFPSYVFVRVPKLQLHNLFLSNSINKVLQVADPKRFLKEVDTVRKVELVGLEEELEFNCEIHEGDRFMIQSGAWEGVCGWLKKKDKRFEWTVEIEFLHEFIRATIDPSDYKMIRLDS